MKIQKTAMVLISLAAVLSWSSVPAVAQRGRSGGGGGATPGGRPRTWVGTPPFMPQPGVGDPLTGRDERAGCRPAAIHDMGWHSAAEHLAQNPKLSSKLAKLFAAGTNLQQEAAGFNNCCKFAAAAHVSHNLGIPFDQLRTRMASGESLGQAIHELKPAVDHEAEEKKASEQAEKDLRESES